MSDKRVRIHHILTRDGVGGVGAVSGVSAVSGVAADIHHGRPDLDAMDAMVGQGVDATDTVCLLCGPPVFNSVMKRMLTDLGYSVVLMY